MAETKKAKIKQKILVVEDDEDIRNLVLFNLEMTGEYELLSSDNGEEALVLAQKHIPALVILDVMLPGIDGYQVCREVRAKHEIPIIMLSAKGEVFDKVLGLELGADDYIEKPFDSKEMVARVKAVLETMNL